MFGLALGATGAEAPAGPSVVLEAAPETEVPGASPAAASASEAQAAAGEQGAVPAATFNCLLDNFEYVQTR